MSRRACCRKWSGQANRVGEVTTTLGLGGIPIAGIAGDQQAALFGQLCWSAGEAKNTYGTGCFLLQNIGTEFVRSKHRLITTVAASAQHRLEYALEGSVFIGGAVVQWLRDNLKLIGASADVEALAASVPDTNGVLFVPAFVGLGAPHWDPHAGGLLIGLRRDTKPGHIARAALESIAFQVADVLEAVHSETNAPLGALRVDGGAAVNDLLMQFQADILGVPVVRPRVTETTALGAAYLAGLATGFWPGPDDLRSKRHNDVRFEPKMDANERSRAQSALASGRRTVQKLDSSKNGARNAQRRYGAQHPRTRGAAKALGHRRHRRWSNRHGRRSRCGCARPRRRSH